MRTVELQVLYSRVLRDYLLSAADQGLLLSWLVRDRPDEMRAAHDTAVARLPGATDTSTISALRRVGAPATAELVARLLDPLG